MTPVAIAAIVCMSVLIALVLVLSHLKALHLTKSDAENLKQWLGSIHDQQQDTIRELSKTVLDLSVKLAALGNRVR